jgi:cbb3-type cytochrome oxidase subunit 3
MYTLIELIIGILISGWIYRDGKRRQLKDAASWAIIGFLLGLIGYAGYWYWVLRPNKRGPTA